MYKDLWKILFAPEDGTGAAAPAAEAAEKPPVQGEVPAAEGGEKTPEAEGGDDAAAAAAAGEEGADAAATGDDGKPTKKTGKPWYQKRIDALTFERDEALRIAKAAATAQQPAAEPVAGEDGQPMLPATEVTRQAAVMAKALAAQQEFKASIANVNANGTKDFQDWDESMEQLAATGFLGDVTAVEAALAVPENHRVLRHLGLHPEEAQRIQALTPAARAVALVQLSNELKPKPKVKTFSKAPAPITPVTGNTAVGNEPDIADPALPMADFVKLRNKQAEERRAGRR